MTVNVTHSHDELQRFNGGFLGTLSHCACLLSSDECVKTSNAVTDQLNLRVTKSVFGGNLISHQSELQAKK